MKWRLFFSLMALVALCMSACEKNGKKPENFKLYVNGVDKEKPKADGRRYLVPDTALTAKQVLSLLYEQSLLRGEEDGVAGEFCHNSSKGYGGTPVLRSNLDTVNTRLVFIAGNLETLERNPFIDADFFYDYVIVVKDIQKTPIEQDTIAYIPNAQRRAAYEQIKELWNAEEWDEMYEVFENGLQFIPCTGAEYRELQAAGRN
ncbi:MAG: hypothetical protein IKP62_10680 [Salinivirgaceae bacterium]|nr:hypothetical protein [Salinivirgaceae bacterium]